MYRAHIIISLKDFSNRFKFPKDLVSFLQTFQALRNWKLEDLWNPVLQTNYGLIENVHNYVSHEDVDVWLINVIFFSFQKAVITIASTASTTWKDFVNGNGWLGLHCLWSAAGNIHSSWFEVCNKRGHKCVLYADVTETTCEEACENQAVKQ